MTNGFDWFTGLATIDATCPPRLAEPQGLRRFYAAPNHPEFGSRVPRILMHESLHAFQLAGSYWLQQMVAEEWERVLDAERTGRAKPPGPLRHQYGRHVGGAPLSVRDLVECLARFWDVHLRGPDRVLAEEPWQDPDGRIARLLADRRARGGIPYTDEEYDAAMLAGAGLDTYVRPYLWLLAAAKDSPAVGHLGRHDPSRNAKRATWAVNILLPIIGFIALNTDDPVRAFITGIDYVLADPQGLSLPTTAENVWELIDLDQLTAWAPLSQRLAAHLKEQGLPPRASLTGPVERIGWREHPVYRFLPERFAAWQNGLMALISEEPPEDPQRPWLGLGRHLLRDVLRKHAFAGCGLMGLPDFRAALGVAFSPPLLRFDDRQLPATESAAPWAPWSIDDQTLIAAVEEAVHRHRLLRTNDLTARLGIASLPLP